MPIYLGADPEDLDSSIASIWDRQSLKPAEILIIVDGPINDGIRSVLQRRKSQIACLRTIEIAINKGLGYALRIGVAECRHDWIARMDADDISHESRFAQQAAFIETNPDVDIVGGYGRETGGTHKGAARLRRCPTTHDDIVSYARKRCPFNHPTVMFRKQIVIDAGNYLPYRKYQDYELWARLIQSGARCRNLATSLVDMKADKSMARRRGGLGYARTEFAIQRKFLKSGFLSGYEFARNVIVRSIFRLVPVTIRFHLYKIILRQS